MPSTGLQVEDHLHIHSFSITFQLSFLNRTQVISYCFGISCHGLFCKISPQSNNMRYVKKFKVVKLFMCFMLSKLRIQYEQTVNALIRNL